MARVENDKYYTPDCLAEYCVNKTKEIIGEENITEYLEPSAGKGVFLNYLPENTLAYDLYPEGDKIIKQDYLELELPYKKGRCIIGNPPFGDRNVLSVKFFKKSILLGDYISFILPISQLNNDQKMYEFDLIYSEDLGDYEYSGITKRCCLNIYKRPINGINKKKHNHALKDVTVIEYRRGSKDTPPDKYDFAMCTWGDGCCGKQIEYVSQYAQEHYIIINNEALRDKILNICHNTDWRNLYPSVSSAKLQTWKIYKHFKDMIPDIK